MDLASDKSGRRSPPTAWQKAKATLARDWPRLVEGGVRLLIVMWIWLLVVAKLMFDGLLELDPAPHARKQMLPQHPKTVREQVEFNQAAERTLPTTPSR